MELKVGPKRFTLTHDKADGSTGFSFEMKPGHVLLATDQKTGQQHRLFLLEKGNQVAFQVDGVSRFGEWVQTARAGTSSQSDADLIAQFPGKVRKVLVRVGDVVESGASLLQVEAMKMEFPIQAPFKGKVKALPFKDGDQITPGQKLIDLEPV